MLDPTSKIQTPEAYLLSLPRFDRQGAAAYHPGLDRMIALLDAMERPHEAFASVHVAGTNGKGSTASMLAAVATAAGRRTGLHTSPHLARVAERMRIDGVPAPEDWLEGAVRRYRPAFDALRPSFFEATTALSFRYFAEAGVDLAVVEVGLGGRLDATNVVQPRLAVITTISRDHTALLGETLPLIAREKAGIVKPGVPVLTAPAAPDVAAVYRQAAEAQEAPWHALAEEVQVRAASTTAGGLVMRARTPVRDYGVLEVGLPGLHQQVNAGLALRAAELLFPDVRRDPAAVYAGVRDVRHLAGLRGRLDVVQTAPLVVLDVGHNEESLAAGHAFVHAIRRPAGRLFVLLGLLRDKASPEIGRLFAGAGAVVWPVALDGERALAVGDLVHFLRSHDVRLGPGGELADGWAWFRHRATPADALLITGSHQVVGRWMQEQS